MGRNPTKAHKYKNYYLVPCKNPNRYEKWYLSRTEDGKEAGAIRFCNLSSGMNFVDRMIKIEENMN